MMRHAFIFIILLQIVLLQGCFVDNTQSGGETTEQGESISLKSASSLKSKGCSIDLSYPARVQPYGNDLLLILDVQYPTDYVFSLPSGEATVTNGRILSIITDPPKELPGDLQSVQTRITIEENLPGELTFNETTAVFTPLTEQRDIINIQLPSLTFSIVSPFPETEEIGELEDFLVPEPEQKSKNPLIFGLIAIPAILFGAAFLFLKRKKNTIQRDDREILQEMIKEYEAMAGAGDSKASEALASLIHLSMKIPSTKQESEPKPGAVHESIPASGTEPLPPPGTQSIIMTDKSNNETVDRSDKLKSILNKLDLIRFKPGLTQQAEISSIYKEFTDEFSAS